MTTPTVLMVEDTLPVAEVYKAYLRQEKVTLLHVTTGAEAKSLLTSVLPDLLLLDLQLPDMDGMELLDFIRQQQLQSAVIVMTAHGSVDVAVDAMRLGALDYLAKPVNAERLKVTVRNALKMSRLDKLVNSYQKEFERKQFEGFIGSSLIMQGVYRVLESAAPSKASVFITGESGTGKELCAQAIHNLSPRRSHALVTINCAAIPAELMESEIFGHVKGAFSGAVSDRIGAAEMADGGTLFLDELCEMDLALQSKLLRFIQTGYIQRVGESKTRKVDVRFVCATNRDPLKEVEAGRFREDLYYRLHVLPVHLPPLRDRGDDILLIAKEILIKLSQEESKEFSGFNSGAAQILLNYHWPGNVRQLQNVIHQLVVMHTGGEVSREMLPPPLGQEPANVYNSNLVSKADEPVVIRPLVQVERDAIEQAIEYSDGNVVQAAKLLQVSPSTLYRKLHSWGQG